MLGPGTAAGGRAGVAGEGGGRSCCCRAQGDWSSRGAEMRLQVPPRVGEGGTREPSGTVKDQQQEKTRLFLVGGTEAPRGHCT